MDQTLKQQWMTALRSGEYLQGTGSLKYGDKYCCLGVLCSVMEVSMNKRQTSFYYNGERMDVCLSIDLQQDIGMTGENQSKLANMNDEGRSFLEIADYIEKAL